MRKVAAPEICLVVYDVSNEVVANSPVARRYYDPNATDDWQASLTEELANGFSVRLTVISRDYAGPDFDTRVSGGEKAH